MIEYIKAWSNEEYVMATAMFKEYGYHEIRRIIITLIEQEKQIWSEKTI